MEFPTDTKLQAVLLAAFDVEGWHPVSGPAGYSTLGLHGLYITVQPKPTHAGARGPDLSPDNLQRIANAVGAAVDAGGWACTRPEMVKMNERRYTFYAWRIK